ncbi:MAG: hypothetical protein BGO69_12835 [Bacteroidetes bacterium 46-16]|nr:MAG: hypothetical protein BGO69_12835 [Bacteroidetes bacterium 46-16]
MKKVLVVLNGIYTSTYVLNGAVNLAKETNAHLHAIFLNADHNGKEGGYFFPNDLALTENIFTGESIAAENEKMIDANVTMFQNDCETTGVSYTVDKRRRMALKDLVDYSIYFDFILADSKANFYQYFLSDILVDAHCPVILTSSDMKQTEDIILAYDNSPSSMYAIKMFSYLFPEWKNKQLYLVHVNIDDEIGASYEDEIKGFLALRYPNVTVNVLHGKVQESLIEFVKSKSANSLVVMGAYGRSSLSRIFRSSLSKRVLETTDASVFATHV